MYKNYLREGVNHTHKLSGTRFYNIYRGIRHRCDSPKSISYKYYGKKGIKCEWRTFEEFKNDMYESYLEHVKQYGEKDTTIERNNNDKSYCKENCERATRKEQNNNKINNTYIDVNGDINTTMQQINKYGINKNTVFHRIRKGRSKEKAVTHKTNWNIAPRIDLNGISHTLTEWSNILGIPYCTLLYRMKRGYNSEQMLSKDKNKRVLGRRKKYDLILKVKGDE